MEKVSHFWKGFIAGFLPSTVVGWSSVSHWLSVVKNYTWEPPVKKILLKYKWRTSPHLQYHFLLRNKNQMLPLMLLKWSIKSFKSRREDTGIDARSRAAKGAREGHYLPNQIAKHSWELEAVEALCNELVGWMWTHTSWSFWRSTPQRVHHLDLLPLRGHGYRPFRTLLQGSMVGLHTCRFQSASWRWSLKAKAPSPGGDGHTFGRPECPLPQKFIVIEDSLYKCHEALSETWKTI